MFIYSEPYLFAEFIDSIKKITNSRLGRWKGSFLSSRSQGQWEWLTNQASARSNQINELLARLGQFNQQYDALREFVREGNDLLGREKPVGSSAARIHKQMETCQVCVMSL